MLLVPEAEVDQNPRRRSREDNTAAENQNEKLLAPFVKDDKTLGELHGRNGRCVESENEKPQKRHETFGPMEKFTDRLH